MMTLMNLFEFLDKQSGNRLVFFGIVLIFVIYAIFEGISEIVRNLKKK